MRVYKENTFAYEPFFKSLPQSEVESDYPIAGSSNRNNNYSEKDRGLYEKYSHMFSNLLNFETEIKNSKNQKELAGNFKKALKKVLPVKEASVFFIEESPFKVFPADEAVDTDFVNEMINYAKEGILNYVFEKDKPMLVPELKSFNSEGSKYNYLIYPIKEENERKGFLSIHTSITKENLKEFDKQIISLLMTVCMAKMERLVYKEKLNKVYEELQIYQAKLSNDFRLSAIGELTEGIVEDISTPLQVIVSQTDMIEQDENNYAELKKIKSQIKKINNVTSRLVKFANINQKDAHIAPVNINELVDEYYQMVKSTLDGFGIECVLDFANDLPSILSHSNYIFQLLTNILGIIKKQSEEAGIIIQTRYKNDSVNLQVITTSDLVKYSEKKTSNSKKPLNIRILENLMQKHEGSVAVERLQSGGSMITLQFPLIRKMRK